MWKHCIQIIMLHLMLVGCVALVQDESARSGADATADHQTTVPRVTAYGRGPLAQPRWPTKRDNADRDGGTTEQQVGAYDFVFDSHQALAQTADHFGTALAQLQRRSVGQVAAHSEHLRAKLIGTLQGLVRPPLQEQLRWLPVAHGHVFLPDIAVQALLPYSFGPPRWDGRRPPHAHREELVDGYWSVTRPIDLAKLPQQLRDLLDHPLIGVGSMAGECTASLTGLQILGWLHPYNVGLPESAEWTSKQQAQWTWDHSEYQLIADIKLGSHCRLRQLTAWRSARLAPARTFETVVLTPKMQSLWFTRLLPQLRQQGSWERTDMEFATHLDQCRAPTTDPNLLCRGSSAAKDWFEYGATDPTVTDPLEPIVTITALRNGGDLWLKVMVVTETEPCGGNLDFFGYHQSLWHVLGEPSKPQKAKVLRGFDGATCDHADIDGDGQPDTLPVVEPPYEHVCPC
ncbi:MAG: hypothetical protein EXR77_08085 [Myxococcales bacterium]|nr:hypothetical protein [Myxococcales bacterium]